MEEMEFDEQARQVLQILRQGAFLTTCAEEKTNTMTIGWGYLGWSWRKPVLAVMVRHNRFTHELLEKNGEFTVTLPLEDMSKEQAICGTKSGRDTDKMKACDFSLIPGKTVSVPLIACKALQYECKVLCKTEMTSQTMQEDLYKQCYGKMPGDHHTFYFGEITSSYRTE